MTLPAHLIVLLLFLILAVAGCCYSAIPWATPPRDEDVEAPAAAAPSV